MGKKKPTIAELEKILDGPPCKIILKPDGSLETELDNDIVCPFCKEGDFDLIGLKYHLTWYCNPYKHTEI